MYAWTAPAAGPPIIQWGEPLMTLGGQQAISFAKSPSMTYIPLYEQVSP